MYRQNSDYHIPMGVSREIAKMIRHQRYVNAREHYHCIPYYDNMLVVVCYPDFQRIALQKALARMKQSCPYGYEIIVNYYFGDFKSITTYAKSYGISRQAMSAKLKKYLEYLRILAYEELNAVA